MENIDEDRRHLSEAIESLQTDVERLQNELQVSEEKMKMIVQYPGDKDGLDSVGE